jgi:carbon monoxide dehydrogenase subunit G
LKKQILSIFATLTLLIPMAIIGFAGFYGRVNADIPFDFMVGNKEFKAGKYTVSRVQPSNNAGTLVIHGGDKGGTATFNVNNAIDKGDAGTRLIFRRYGNQYFLAKVFDGYSGEGAELLKSKSEREAAKKRDTITQNAVEPETVTVVAQLNR